MAVQTTITITHGNESIGTIENKLLKPVSKSKEQAIALENFSSAMAGLDRQAKMTVQVNSGDAVAASGTITFTASNTANDTVLINGVTMTCVTSGATNNQWNVGAGTATQQAAAFVSAVNASTTSLISGQVTASNIAGVVTLTSNFLGIAGNAVTTAKGTDSGTVMTVSGARLASGAVPATSSASNTYHYGVA